MLKSLKRELCSSSRAPSELWDGRPWSSSRGSGGRLYHLCLRRIAFRAQGFEQRGGVVGVRSQFDLCWGFQRGGRCSRCTYSVLYGLLLADRLKSSNERLERTYTNHTLYTSPCLKPSALASYWPTDWIILGETWTDLHIPHLALLKSWAPTSVFQPERF